MEAIKNSDIKLVEKLIQARQLLLQELKKIIVGQNEVVDLLLISLFAKGHSIIVGVPGLAKTMLVSTISQILDLSFKRIQFTPDLMPSDITGTDVIEENPQTGKKMFRFVPGPIFANIILADEINRTPPKTQSALLQAMQEYKVTVGGNTYQVPLPFFVIATQNPIEQEGTYPLPEAQLDRFLFQINITYPTPQEEKEIILKTTSDYQPQFNKILNANEILELQNIVRKIPVPDSVLDYAVKIVNQTRTETTPLDFIKKWISWGASPRATQALILGGKVNAILNGRYVVGFEDINFLLLPVLRHRLILSFYAEAEGIKVDQIIQKIESSIKK